MTDYVLNLVAIANDRKSYAIKGDDVSIACFAVRQEEEPSE
jgi:hypothetical protein